MPKKTNIEKKSIEKITNDNAINLKDEEKVDDEVLLDQFMQEIEDEEEFEDDDFDFDNLELQKGYTINNLYDDVDALQDASFYDVNQDQAMFMELRNIVDNAFARRNKSKREEDEYDEIIYNLTTNCINDKHLQDLMGYCYKKGKYDFCIMNFEKYMQWTILAAANGNAFSLSKLQLFLANQLDEILSVENITEVMKILSLNYEKFVILLSKKICEKLVDILNLYPENLIKQPEVYLEQSEQLMRKFDKAKQEATSRVIEECKDIINKIHKLDEEVEKVKNMNSEEEEYNSEPKLLTEEQIQQEAIKQENSSNLFVKKQPSKKKFRW